MILRRYLSTLLLMSTLTLSATDTLKIISWNIFMVPPIIFKSCQSERAGKIATYLHTQQADVIVLQEAFMKDINQQLLEKMQDEFPYQSTPTKKGAIKSNSGVWILSKYPILKEDFITYKNRKGGDIFSKKGAVFVDIKINDKKIQVIATHTQSLSKFRKVREKQLQQLKTDLADIYFDKNIPQLIVGDLNVDYHDTSAYHSLTNILDVLPITYTGVSHSWDGKNNQIAGKYFEHIQETLDYILLRNSQSQQTILSPIEILKPHSSDCFCKESFNDLSDHYPISAIIHL